MLAGLVILAAGAVAPVAEAQQAPGAPSLYELVEEMKAHRFVDLTHAFRPGIPHWPGFEDEVRPTLYHYDEGVGVKGAGFLAHADCPPGQWANTVTPPDPSVTGTRRQEEITGDALVRGMVVEERSDVEGRS